MPKDDFLQGYIDTALWSEQGRNGEPLDSAYTITDLTPKAQSKMAEDCQAFQAATGSDLDIADTHYAAARDSLANNFPSNASPQYSAGRDFWLTRNGHGVRFGDRGLGEVGERLTMTAQLLGETNI